MKKKLIEKKEELQSVISQMGRMIETAEAADKPMSAEDQKTFDDLDVRMKALEADIAHIERMIEIQDKQRSFQAPTPSASPEAKAKARYSLMRAVRLKSQGKKLDGIELEMHQEAVKEARDSGFSIKGIGIPSLVNRDITVGAATSAGDSVATNVSGIMPSLKPQLFLESLGARVLSNLVGNERIPIGNALAASTWEGETDAAAETTPTIKKEDLTPNRLASYIEISEQWMRQNDPSAEQYLIDELTSSEARAVETAALNGSGSGQPLGLIGHGDINVVAMGTNGGTPTHAKLVDMMTQVEVDNGNTESMAFIVTPEIKGYLQTLKIDAGSGQFVWDSNSTNALMGYRAAVSNLLPKTLTKGTGTGLHAILFGDFSRLLIANWGTRDLIVNPFIKDIEGLTRLTLNSFWDCAPVHGQAFSTIKDAATS